MENKSKIYQQAEIAFGKKHQLVKVMEELAELSQAIAKIINTEKPTKKMYENVFEEIADVEIMVEQLKQILSVSDHVEYYKRKKLARLQDIVNEKQNWGKKGGNK